jgi:hypothetical protein
MTIVSGKLTLPLQHISPANRPLVVDARSPHIGEYVSDVTVDVFRMISQPPYGTSRDARHFKVIIH